MTWIKELTIPMKKKIFCFLLITTISFAQIDKIEPPFLYSDMNLSDVQVMFYGKNIAQNEVSVSKGLIIKEIQKT